MRAAVLLACLAAGARAERPLALPAPDIPAGAVWLNSRQISLARLRGRKAAVVAFINPTAINSIRVLPALAAWFDRYALSQLMVVAVIAPEFEFQRDEAWVKAFLKTHRIEYPVVLDGDRALWRAYGNEGWPALHLVDRNGRVAFDRLGEGGYGEFEKEIRAALADIVGEASLPPPANVPEPRERDCGAATAEFLLGSRPGSKTVSRARRGGARARMMGRDGEAERGGRWDESPDGLRLAQANKAQDAFLRVAYWGAQALAVLSPAPDGPVRVYVRQDGLWLHAGNAGKDVRFDDDGRSFLTIQTPGLYDLARGSGGRSHELDLVPERKGTTIHSLSFADSCLLTALP